MGLSDTVRCYADVPGAELLGDGEFQTRDLGCRFDHFSIDNQGRLIHQRRMFTEASPDLLVSQESIVVPIHRDVRLDGRDASGNYGTYCARFTDGILQWVKPWNELSELQRVYAVIVES
jgi:hypothetical protein